MQPRPKERPRWSTVPNQVAQVVAPAQRNSATDSLGKSWLLDLPQFVQVPDSRWGFSSSIRDFEGLESDTRGPPKQDTRASL
jgi:hypothetical protein